MSLAACGGSESDQPPRPRTDERTTVTIQSYVYASPDEPSFRTAQRVRDQIKSAFGGLKTMRVLASNKELSNGLDDKLYREPLVLSRPYARDEVVMRVWFRYTDEVFAPAAAQRGAPILVGGLHRQDDTRVEQILTACTASSPRERELKGRLQAAFDGSLPTCQEAILNEQAKIDAARVRLDGPDEEVVPEEVTRTYLPVIARLYAVKGSRMGQYPRFEDVIPQAGRAASSGLAGLGGRARPNSLASADAAAGDSDAVDRDEKSEAPVVVAGAAAPVEPHHASADDPADPDSAPEIHVPTPAVVAAAPPKSSNPAMPRGESESSFSWEDLGDKRFWVMWLALFALYPLLKRRQS